MTDDEDPPRSSLASIGRLRHAATGPDLGLTSARAVEIAGPA